MERLTDDDFRVLVVIERGELRGDADRVPEFPHITKQQIMKATDSLRILGLVELDPGTNIWTITYEGRQYMDRQQSFLQDIIDEYYKGEGLIG